MEGLRDLWWRIHTSPLFHELPPALREPPGLYLLAAVVLALLVLLLWGGWRLVFGGPGKAKKAVAEGRRGAKRDLRAHLEAGDYRAAGELYEALDQPKKALATYQKGGCHEERVDLLLRLDRRADALAAARDSGVWHRVAEIAEGDGQMAEAALAWERAGRPFLAARAWEAEGDALQAARCFTAAGLESEAVRVLGETEGREAAEVLESAVRASLDQAVGASMSLDMSRAVRRSAQLWLAEGEPERAWRLAVDAEQLELAAPIARDFLEPSARAAELCEKAGDWLAAATIWSKLGETGRVATAQAEHHERRGDAVEAARWLEKAGQWNRAADHLARAGDHLRAAELYEKGGDLMSAAELYGLAGAVQKQEEIQFRLRASGADIAFSEDPTVQTGAVRMPAAHHTPHSTESGVPTQGPPGATPGVGADAYATAKKGGAGAEVAAEAPSPTPTQLGVDDRYQLLQELGRGGMGVVYLAEDRMLQRRVAYKMLPRMLATETSPEALLAEARAAARLSHPNIVQVYDVGRTGDGFFVVMELVEGSTFEDLLAQRDLSINGVINVGRQIAAALAHAHGRQIIHRDLKPSNLLWDSENKRVKLSDFGLARVSDDGTGKVATRPAGTPSYMAPEQILGQDLDVRVDIYAFGCVLYEMATRTSVFGVGVGSLHKHLHEPPGDPRQERAEIPEGLAQLILDCLAKDPAQRPASADEVAKRLAALAG